MKDAMVDKYDENDTVVSIYIKSRKTEQCNTGSFETLKSAPVKYVRSRCG